jgi:hypothetical protein
MTAIHSFGYDSNFKKSSVLNVQDFSNSLLHSLLHSPVVLATEVIIHMSPDTRWK